MRDINKAESAPYKISAPARRYLAAIGKLLGICTSEAIAENGDSTKGDRPDED